MEILANSETTVFIFFLIRTLIMKTNTSGLVGVGNGNVSTRKDWLSLLLQNYFTGSISHEQSIQKNVFRSLPSIMTEIIFNKKIYVLDKLVQVHISSIVVMLFLMGAA